MRKRVRESGAENPRQYMRSFSKFKHWEDLFNLHTSSFPDRVNIFSPDVFAERVLVDSCEDELRTFRVPIKVSTLCAGIFVSRSSANSGSDDGVLWPNLPTSSLRLGFVGCLCKQYISERIHASRESDSKNRTINFSEFCQSEFQKLQMLTLPSLYMFDTISFYMYKCALAHQAKTTSELGDTER